MHGAGGIDELSPCGPNLVCEVAGGRGARTDGRPGRARRRRVLAGRAARRLAGRERTGDSRRVRRCREAPPARRSCSTPRERSPPQGTPRSSATGSSSRARAVDSGAAAERLDRLVAFSRAEEVPRDRSRRRNSALNWHTPVRHFRRYRRSPRVEGRRPTLFGWGPRRPGRSAGPDGPADGAVSRRARGARADRDRRGQAAIAVGRRPPAGRRPCALAAAFEQAGAAAVSILVDERFAGTIDDLRAARAAARLPLLAKGFFTHGGGARRAAGGGRRCSAPDPARPRRSAGRRAHGARRDDRPRHARRGARRRRARARRGARRRPDRHQRPRPLDLRDRPQRTARAGRPGTPRPRRDRRERDPLARRTAPRPSWRAPTPSSSAPR